MDECPYAAHSDYQETIKFSLEKDEVKNVKEKSFEIDSANTNFSQQGNFNR